MKGLDLICHLAAAKITYMEKSDSMEKGPGQEDKTWALIIVRQE